MSTEVQVTPKEFREGVQADAEVYLRKVLGSEQGKLAAARVGLAFSAAARSAKDPAALYNCDRASVINCIALCAMHNLMPGGPLAPVWLVPKGGQLEWWLSHRGMAILALRGGYQVMAIPVHVDDAVSIQFGEVTMHEPDPDSWPETLKELRGCYLTIRRLSDGVALGRPWMPAKAIDRRRRQAQTQAVWNAWPIEQAQKTIIKWAMARGYVPIESAEVSAALDAEPIDAQSEVKESRRAERPTGDDALGIGDDDPAVDEAGTPTPALQDSGEQEPVIVPDKREKVEAKPASKPAAAAKKPAPPPVDDVP